MSDNPNKIFNVNNNSVTEGYLSDGSDTYANGGMVLGFHHIPSGKEIYFKAAITAFNESYNCDWTSEIVYGRADAIMLFKNTERRISLAFNIAAATKSEAYDNLSKVGDLSKFLYPYYASIGDATSIGQSPLVRLKVMNLLSTQKGSGAGAEFSALATLSNSDADQGMLGAIMSLNINHNLQNSDAGSIEAANGVLLPKLIEVNLDFNVIHEHTMGWTGAGDNINFGQGIGTLPSGESFPYGLGGRADASLPSLVAITQAVDAAASATSIQGGSDAISAEDQVDPDIDLDLEGLDEASEVNGLPPPVGLGTEDLGTFDDDEIDEAEGAGSPP
tara:strand:+ start:1614 stop:2609 length:996 start_codon:yes stop_codon:yes gene_type:complete